VELVKLVTAVLSGLFVVHAQSINQGPEQCDAVRQASKVKALPVNKRRVYPRVGEIKRWLGKASSPPERCEW
jgi:hypothetical protein